MTYYGQAEQARHYRQAAHDNGCTCPELPPHVHLLDCPLYQVPGGVPGGLHDHEPSASEQNPGRKAPTGDGGRLGADDYPRPPTLTCADSGASPVHGTECETTGGGAGVVPDTGDAQSPSLAGDMADVSWKDVSADVLEAFTTDDGRTYRLAADGSYHEMLDQQHDSDEGRPWL